MSDQHVTVVAKPWGREVIYASTELYIGKIIEINDGARLSLQYHEAKDETIYVLDGRLRLVIGDRELLPADLPRPDTAGNAGTITMRANMIRVISLQVRSAGSERPST